VNDDYRAINRRNWDERAPAHAASAEYRVARFAADPQYLSDVVQFDLPRLGSVDGLRGIHLQCHIGTDTVSLARLGARMSGLDFSPVSIAEARRLAATIGADVSFPPVQERSPRGDGPSRRSGSRFSPSWHEVRIIRRPPHPM
jgi:hypothetical protein